MFLRKISCAQCFYAARQSPGELFFQNKKKFERMKAVLPLLKGFAGGRKKGAIRKVLVIYALCHCGSGYKLVTL